MWYDCTILYYALSSIPLFVIPWTVAPQAPLSMEFSRHEYWSGLPCPLPGGLLNPEMNPRLLHLLHGQAGSLPLVPPGKPSYKHGKTNSQRMMKTVKV